MLLYAIDVKKPANILVITGDADFTTHMATSLQSRLEVHYVRCRGRRC
ncbi:unnamed protein product [Arabidopsis halleri]